MGAIQHKKQQVQQRHLSTCIINSASKCHFESALTQGNAFRYIPRNSKINLTRQVFFSVQSTLKVDDWRAAYNSPRKNVNIKVFITFGWLVSSKLESKWSFNMQQALSSLQHQIESSSFVRTPSDAMVPSAVCIM